MLRFRWALVALSAVLAIVLLANGSVLIGGVIAVMAVIRTAMLLQWRRHGRQLPMRSRQPMNRPVDEG